MLNLPQVTLICLTGKDIGPHLEAMQASTEGINFGDAKMIFQPTIKSIDEWNHHIIYELHQYVQTPYALLIHADGYPIHPGAWRPEFLDYDYIGAPWPLPVDTYSYRDESGGLQRVGNSVSLRSKRLLDLIATRPEEWFWEQKKRYGNCNEDGFITCHNRIWLESQGYRIAPVEVAKYFSKEHEIEENQDIPPDDIFAFHTADI